MNNNLTLIIVLIVTLLGLAVLVFAGPSPEKARKRRLANIRERHADGTSQIIAARMRRAISNHHNHDAKLLVSLIPNPDNMVKRLNMTGKKWTLSKYLTACAMIFLGLTAFMLLRGFPIFMSILVGAAAGLGLPHMWVGRLISKRVQNFTTKFPDALELLVRGLRSGLPIAETLNVVSTEIPGPVGEEFKLITERIKIGKTMDQALQQTAERLGTPEFQFFVISLAIQRETGGNLAETLSNLASVLRQRAQMKLKIKAMSSESKASAYIIGALPFIVFGLICSINYDYMSPFFTSNPEGIFGLGIMQVVGIGGMCWMGIGAFIMSQMISFEI